MEFQMFNLNGNIKSKVKKWYEHLLTKQEATLMIKKTIYEVIEIRVRVS